MTQAADAASERISGQADQSITLLPAPAEWRLREGAGSLRAQKFREQLGLPDGPAVMSGHQAGFWHCGILAKWFAAQAVAQRDGACAAWLVVDTDDNEPTVTPYPALRLGDGRLESRPWQAAPGAHVRAGTPAGSRAPIDPAPAPESGRSVEVPSLVQRGLQRMAGALRAQMGAASLAAQYAHAAADVIGEATGAEAPALVFASALAGTDLFSDLVGRMRDDPGACGRAYNEAVRAHPEAQLRELEISERRGRYELPLWRIEREAPRQPVYADELGAGEGTLAARALLLTGLMRMAGCDLFIHGAGGGVYDRVTERWLEAWLGESLAPAVVASATWYLPLRETPAPAPAELEQALWARHAARHDPAMLGEREAGGRKRALAAEIAALPPKSPARAELYRQMHELLDAVRVRHGGEIQAMDARAADLRAQLRDRDVLLDRTWSFGLFPDERLRALRRAIDEAIT